MPEHPRPQNVIWMTSDHMRYDHVAAHGHPGMVTPSLDRLVQEGSSFSNCFVQSPICMPSRCSFMTGFYPQQTGVTANGHCLPPQFEPTVATLFRGAGYSTAQIGKLHFQPHEDLDFDPRSRFDYGFDVFWPSEERGNYSDAYYHWLEGRFPQYASEFRVPRSNDLQRAQFESNPQPVDAPWQATHAGWIVDTACRYLSSRRSEPQFLHLGFYNPHPPLTPVREAWDLVQGRELQPRVFRPEEWSDKPEPLATILRQRDQWTEEQFAAYRLGLAAMVTEMDLAIGVLLGWLEANEMLDDTLLVFSSDHGDFAGDHGITHKGTACYDQVMRVPLIMRWPQGLPVGGRRLDGLVEKLDVLPTLINLCGGRTPGNLPGVDLTESLRNLDDAGDNIRQDVFAYYDRMAMLRTADTKYLRFEPEGAEVLYDLAADPDELHNVASDPTYRDLLEKMREKLLHRLLTTSVSPQRKLHPY